MVKAKKSSNKRYGTVASLAKKFKVSLGTLLSRISESGIVPIRGRDKSGRVHDFYPEPQVRELCADLLAPLPVVGKSGFITLNGVRYGTVKAFASEMKTRKACADLL